MHLFIHFPASNLQTKLPPLRIASHCPSCSAQPPSSALQLQMGNNGCCSDARGQEGLNQRVEIEKNPLEQAMAKRFQLPPLSPLVQTVFCEKRPFEVQMTNVHNPQVKQLGNETYYGEVDESGLPSGWGRLFKNIGAHYVGQFRQGKTEGQGLYIFADGSYYEGPMLNNVAESTAGHFHSIAFDYRGGFHLNQFHGHGIETGSDYEFEGDFERGRRKLGTLRWREGEEKFVYSGGFDEKGKFSGKGKLQDPFGDYEGHFREGLKEGFGSFQFKTKIRYEGYYRANVKSGRGSIINADGTTAFCGEFLNGLPHGKGYATDKKGGKHSLEWNEGVYADLL